MYEIIEYDKQYEEDLKQLWVNVCVEEYGFEEWRLDMNTVQDDMYEKMLLAICDNKVIGSIGYVNKGENIAEIKRVYVYSEYRGTGISQHFFDLIMEEIKEKGYEKVLIETWSKFNRAINFYLKNQFLLKEKKGECHRYERIITRI